MTDRLSFEAQFWGTCANTFQEERKQFVYARHMGIKRSGFSFDGQGKRIVDIGGGPVSMLLKTVNAAARLVIDPLKYPDWVYSRYEADGIAWFRQRGEEPIPGNWDEVWIYNCLQHVEDPETVIERALDAAPVIRIFEWINIPAHEGHPHELTAFNLDYWLNRRALSKLRPACRTGFIYEDGCEGEYYAAVRSQ